MSVYLWDADFTLHCGDALEVLRSLPAESVDCCVTSPPYWGLRDYGVAGQLGLEATPQEFVARLVGIFEEVRRVLAPQGTCWVNLGDSYATGLFTRQGRPRNVPQAPNDWTGTELGDRGRADHVSLVVRTDLPGLKPKDLVGIPWRVAFALQDAGWYLRSDVIWSKPNPMPESVTDRPTKAHEYVFLLAKQPRYFFDQEAVREAWTSGRDDMREKGVRTGSAYLQQGGVASNDTLGDLPPEARRGPDGRRATAVKAGDASIQHRDGERWPGSGRNVRTVWEIATQPYAEAHFATYPEELVRRCILAGCPDGGTVLDPFLGSGTTALVARKHGRSSVGIELNKAYCELAAKRLAQQSLFAEPAA